MAYSRNGQQRELYQFASWSDRPSARIVQLLSERIEARGMFESVSRLGGGIGGGPFGSAGYFAATGAEVGVPGEA